jgi:hypothetical protein
MKAYSRITSGFPPFQQGGLDSLCGLYSIVNAERYINHSTDEETQQLFDDLIYYLSRRGLLSKFLIGGIIHTEMLVILKKVVGKKRISNVEIPWRGVQNPDLTKFWKSMQDFLDGTSGRAIILGLQGYHDHWTRVLPTVPFSYMTQRLSNACRAHPVQPFMLRGNANIYFSLHRRIFFQMMELRSVSTIIDQDFWLLFI